MMQKVMTFVFTILFGLVMNNAAFAGIPSDYSVVESGTGKALYAQKSCKTDRRGKKTCTDTGIYAVVVDPKKANIRVGIVDETQFSFLRHPLSDWWSDQKNTAFAIVNGQFFDTSKVYTSLSFPLKSNGILFNSQDLDPGLEKRTLVIDYDNMPTIYSGYKIDYLASGREVIVGLSPSVDKSLSSSIGRNYIGVFVDKDAKTKQKTTSIVFLLAKSATGKTTMSELAKFGVSSSNVVMMDGSGSAQLRSKSVWMYGDWKFGTPDVRSIANVIAVE